ncbi:hypothetical protein NDU88_006336 [Pleurodeles waltl]|uniref:Uncharacterized protein n=1 Tax=Pleurodeles waltl TaxID=8319 RepID=A0AAV7UKP4_PLEWA|nr:hypothetical protein NDU88_006336 [Pleurodeles waltl]
MDHLNSSNVMYPDFWVLGNLFKTPATGAPVRFTLQDQHNNLAGSAFTLTVAWTALFYAPDVNNFGCQPHWHYTFCYLLSFAINWTLLWYV